MGTIVSKLANFYYDFYEGEVFSMDKAEQFFKSCDDMIRRANYIKEIYLTILSSSTINETSKILIKTRKSYADVARYYNNIHEKDISNTGESDKKYHLKTAAHVKADVYYTNEKLKNTLRNSLYDTDYAQEDYFTLVIYQDIIISPIWDILDEALEKLKAELNRSLINRNALWLNIPTNAFNKQLSEDDFEKLLNLIKPYFNSQKALAQLKLNLMTKESGYLNYILKDNISLNETDIARRDLLFSLMNKKEQVQRFKDGFFTDQPDIENEPLRICQKNLSLLKEDSEKEKQIRLELMAKIGMIYIKTNGNLNEELQNMVNSFKKQYQKLKDADNNRQKKISQLEVEIHNLKSQEDEKVRMSNII